MGRLDNRVALVFGASPNNGGTSAHFMAREGAKIAVNDFKPEVAEETAEFLRSEGYDAIAVPGNASVEAEVESIVQRTVDHYGYVDTMLNMAGTQYRHSVLDFNLYDWNKQIAGYLTGGMLTTKHVARAMVDKGVEGSIIHLVSDAGHQGEPGNSGYSAVKAGLLNYCRAAAAELGEHGIRVNTISPTFIDHLFWMFPFGPGMFMPRTRGPYNLGADDFLQGIPLGRFCKASDVADAAVFLASKESSFITGADIPLDGGATSKYWAWTPGKHTGITTQDYLATMKKRRYGVEVEE